jgi:hypothetical protein
MHTASMEKPNDNKAGSDPPPTSSDTGERFVTATPAEIAYAEQLLRQIERRYLNNPAELQPGSEQKQAA